MGLARCSARLATPHMISYPCSFRTLRLRWVPPSSLLSFLPPSDLLYLPPLAPSFLSLSPSPSRLLFLAHFFLPLILLPSFPPPFYFSSLSSSVFPSFPPSSSVCLLSLQLSPCGSNETRRKEIILKSSQAQPINPLMLVIVSCSSRSS